MFHLPSRRVLIGAAFLTSLGLPALAQHTVHSAPRPGAIIQKSAGKLPLRAVDASVVAVPPVVRETSVFGTLVNTGRTPVVLNAVRASVAEHGMLMVTRKASGGMQGMSVAETLTVPAGGQLVLSDTGSHLMLMKLRRALTPGETLTLTLSATDGRTFTFQATVRKP